MGHDVIGMEQYVAEGGRPLNRCLDDVRVADLYVVILAWRYGHVPRDSNANPERLSITELEYQAATLAGKPILAFLLDPDAHWPPSEVDALSADADSAGNVARLRSSLGADHLAGIFRSAEDLASQVGAAVAAQGLGLQLVERLLGQTAVTADAMNRFGGGSPLQDSSVHSIKQMVATTGERALVIDLGDGDQWWSTRLYLLASLLRSLTKVRQLVFRRSDGTFAGMASPSAVIDGLAAAFPDLFEFGRRLRNGDGSQDTARETDRQIRVWTTLLKERLPTHGPLGVPSPINVPTTSDFGEADLKVAVRPELLQGWLGERLITRCLRVDADGPTMTQVQQIVDSLLPDVPIERAGGRDKEPKLQVVDRDAFALALAREWVRTGLPRTPVPR